MYHYGDSSSERLFHLEDSHRIDPADFPEAMAVQFPWRQNNTPTVLPVIRMSPGTMVVVVPGSSSVGILANQSCAGPCTTCNDDIVCLFKMNQPYDFRKELKRVDEVIAQIRNPKVVCFH